jgi:hypothetical protein
VFAFMMLFGLVVTLRWADLTADGLRPRGIGAGQRIAWSQVVAVECDERTQGRRTTAFVKVRGADGRTLTLPSHGLRGADDPAFVARLETVRQWWETYRTLSAST